jgi:uncharacterized membrane protein YsdA (DUF1294 family)
MPASDVAEPDMPLTIDNAYPSWLAILSLTTFLAFGWDKLCARRNRQRLSERTLLFLILVGGFVGGWLGQTFFRHKTRRPLFWMVILVATAAHGTLVWLRFRGAGV